MVFKTLPGAKISCLKLSGSEGGLGDKIFVSSETEVKGFSKKGKQFLNFDTNLTEPISSMHVEGGHLLVCGPYVYNNYLDCKDVDYYLCSDKINDVLCLPPSAEPEPLSPILACQDCSLRLLKGSELQYEVEVAGPPLCMRLWGEGSGEGREGDQVLYGTQTGRVGLVQLTAEEPNYCWDMLNDRKYGGVACLSTFDLSGDGVEEIVVGRDDGVVEVYSMDDSDQPRLKFTHVMGESVTGVGGGSVGSAHHEEVVVCTFSGRVIGLTREPLTQQTLSQEVKEKLESLRKEVESLEVKVGVAKEQYQETVAAAQTGSDAVSALPAFQVNDKFSLNQDEAWYTLSIELQCPIDMVVLQSDVPVDLQEVDKSSAVVSHSPPDPENGNFLLATFRCHDATRLEVKVRSIEGQQGTLQAFITPRLEPKTCCLHHYSIKPLSLHQRMHSFDESRPCNTLRVSGQFSLGQAHSWVALCLPDVPARPPVEDSATLFFKSTFIHTQLAVLYR
jgi:Bardet-Biedl syndrome 7 protein